VGTPQKRLLTALGQPLQPVLPDRLQHAEPRLALAIAGRLDQAVLHQPFQTIQRIDRALGPPHVCDSVEGHAPGEDGQPPEKRLLARGEQVVAPGDRCAQRPLPLRQVAGAAGQQRQPRLQPLQHRLGGEEADARGGQLDGQGEPIHAAHDLRDRAGVLRVESEARHDGLRPVDEEAYRVGACNLIQRTRIGFTRQRHGQHRKLALAAHAQGGAAGGEDGQPRRGGQQLGDERTEVGELFEVVQDQEQRLLGQRGQHLLPRRLRGGFGDSQRGRDGGRRQVSIGDRGQGDEEDAIWKVIEEVGCRLQGQAGLPRPAWAG
jgi:hypothetical protein